MEWQHPVFQEMLQFGCSNQTQVMDSFQTYIKLCEVDKLWNVQVAYDKELDIVYLTSADKGSSTLYVPFSTQKALSPALFNKTSTTLLNKHPNAEIMIVLKTPDSSLLTYKLTEGLTKPPTPEYTKEKKAHQEKLQYLKSELNKRKVELFEEAKQRRCEPGECVGSEQSVADTVQSVADTEQSVADTEQSVADTEQSVADTAKESEKS